MKIENITNEIIRKDAGNAIRININTDNSMEFIHVWNGDERLGMLSIWNMNDGTVEIKFKED